jgi:hypothetical protein
MIVLLSSSSGSAVITTLGFAAELSRRCAELATATDSTHTNIAAQEQLWLNMPFEIRDRIEIRPWLACFPVPKE